MFKYGKTLWLVIAVLLTALCLTQAGCESLRNHPLAGDHPPSVPWENM
jgi:hypothetical protein